MNDHLDALFRAGSASIPKGRRPRKQSRAVRRRLPWLAEAERVDLAVYAAVAATPTPRLDGAMRRVSKAANYSRLSLASSAVLAVSGGPRGRTAAVYGLASVGVTATVVNLAIKPLGRRRRPDPVATVPRIRLVRRPKSRSFPSGHTAGAVAFASGAGQQFPLAAVPLHALATLVGYSRVHTGVHYPGDVLAGAVIGSVLAEITTGALDGRLNIGAPDHHPATGAVRGPSGTSASSDRAP